MALWNADGTPNYKYDNPSNEKKEYPFIADYWKKEEWKKDIPRQREFEGILKKIFDKVMSW